MKKLSFLIVMLLLLVGGITVWWNGATSAVDLSDTQQRSFTVKQGEGIREIASDLKAQGLIKDSVAFFLLIKQLGLDGKIQAGEFHLSPSMNAEEIGKTLQVGTFDVRITIPEGKRADEIADILKENYPGFLESWRVALAANEGYLFPDTYSLPKDATIDQIVQTMRDNFEKKYVTLQQGKNSNLSKEELVIISSLVEREARLAQDRPMVASVILNRLHVGMALQIDATIQYALGYNTLEKTWWKKNLTLADLNIASPYNTYDHPGLPPGPIANPGIAVIQAVIQAPDTEYIYYVTDPATGTNHYAKTLAEHNTNIKKYGLE